MVHPRRRRRGPRPPIHGHDAAPQYRVRGLAQPSAGSTRTNNSRVELLFRPAPTDREVELQIVAAPFAADGTARLLPCKLFFNEHLVFDSPFNGPGVIRVTIPALMWNGRAINTLSLELPGVTVSAAGQATQGLDIRWLRTGPLDGQP